MSQDPHQLHKDHTLSVHWTLWKTYIVCQECGTEYETAWNRLLAFRRRTISLFSLLYVGLLLLLNLLPGTSTWYTYCLYSAGLAAFIALLRISLNALQCLFLHRSNNLASHIFQ